MKVLLEVIFIYLRINTTNVHINTLTHQQKHPEAICQAHSVQNDQVCISIYSHPYIQQPLTFYALKMCAFHSSIIYKSVCVPTVLWSNSVLCRKAHGVNCKPGRSKWVSLLGCLRHVVSTARKWTLLPF